ncbi:dTDP-glucose 4,6-dehydratase [Helicobacter sp. MIT 11-5569]|uniref:dTDP-glucose 4,6-dehydratase n=1 Tax=Helicobacter sp. MIT 11-5569 TaxID=1548151 RepID=UPI0019130779|nr:dTDP-glucose 4,6-dehydratase [Helicobacter sp. MIT 11-5569]
MKSLLITGGAGFIGSNFILYFLSKYPQYRIINVDLLTYAGDLENLKGVENYPNYTFVQGNICDEAFIREIFLKYNIEGVIHFAAESHVDNSINNPSAFVQTNVNGTFNLLHNAYLSWFESPNQPKKGKEHCRFHHISTDEVFGSLGEREYFSESTPYAPNSPYSASKASSDMLTRSYHHTYGLQTFITNCSNNYGPKQHDEKLIPTIIRNALQGKEIPIYGDGKNIRDWLFVEDHCIAIDKVFHSSYFGETFNIGGNCERENLSIAKTICAILDTLKPKANGQSYATQIAFVQDRAGHDRRYAVDSSKIESLLGWKPLESFESGIQKTLQWYVEKYKEKSNAK